ncbi:MAG: hypothetical protein AVDCRST_MAG89-3796, partial [uncultured Gemmatimonadetes bacterium]
LRRLVGGARHPGPAPRLGSVRRLRPHQLARGAARRGPRPPQARRVPPLRGGPGRRGPRLRAGGVGAHGRAERLPPLLSPGVRAGGGGGPPPRHRSRAAPGANRTPRGGASGRPVPHPVPARGRVAAGDHALDDRDAAPEPRRRLARRGEDAPLRGGRALGRGAAPHPHAFRPARVLRLEPHVDGGRGSPHRARRRAPPHGPLRRRPRTRSTGAL